MGNIERRVTLGPELRATKKDGVAKLTGYAAIFNSESQDLGGFTESIRTGAFSDVIQRCDVRALFNHNPNIVLGRKKNGTLALEEDASGLKFLANLPDTQTAKDVWESVNRGDVDGCSFSFIVGEQKWSQDGTKRELITIAELMDVGPVTFPAYTSTQVSARSLWPDGEPREVARHLNGSHKSYFPVYTFTRARSETVFHADAELETQRRRLRVKLAQLQG